MAQTMVSQQDRDRLIAEIDALNRLYEDTKMFLEEGLAGSKHFAGRFCRGGHACHATADAKVMLDDYAKL